MISEADLLVVIVRPEALNKDPAARARYSSNPSFSEGADKAHPITSAQKSLLAQPAIAEALEVVYVSGNESAEGAPIDFALAKKGMSRLRKDLVGDETDRELKKKVVDIKSGLKTMEATQRVRVENEQARIERAEQLKAEQEAAVEAKEAARAEREAKEAQQAGFHQHLDEEIRLMHEDIPHLDPAGFLRLCDELELSDDPYIAGREKSGFENKLIQRVSDYLQNPKLLANDFEVMVWLKVGGDKDGPEQTPAQRYAGIILEATKQSLVQSYYLPGQLTVEAVRGWMDVAAAAKPEELEPSIIIEQSKDDEPKRPNGNGSGIAIVFGEKIFASTLKELIRLKPDKLIDTMYMIAEEALDPDDEVKRETAVTILRRCFDTEFLAINILYPATVSRNVKVRQKAIDLRQTLLLIDPVGTSHIFNSNRLRQSAEELTHDQIKILGDVYEKYLKLNGRVLNNQETIELDVVQEKNIASFIEWATNTEEGRSSTLYGRFLPEQDLA